MNKSKECIVLSGVSQGIGRALCKEYISQGYVVFGCARHKPKDLNNSANLKFSCLDVTNSVHVTNWAKEIKNEGYYPKSLINNAAIINTPAPLWEIPKNEFDMLIDINIKGVANMLRAFIPLMLEQKSGKIINMSSGWGRMGEAQVSSYCASKFALEGLTQSLSKELPHGLLAISLSPGIVQTSMLKKVAPHYFEQACNADSFAKKAVRFIESLTQKENGTAQSIN